MIRNSTIFSTLCKTACCFLLSINTLQADETSESPWAHSIELYAQAVNIGGDAKVGRVPLGVDVDPKFIMDHLEMAGMFRFESINNNEWGYLVDYGFMELSGKKDGLVQDGPDLLKAEIELRQGVFEVKGFKRATNETATFDITFGFRWWDNDGKATVDLVNGTRIVDEKISEDWIDYVVGLRLMDDINESWRAYFSADVGMGADTNFTSMFHTGAMYHLNDWSDLNLSYRSVWVDYKDEGHFEYVTSTQGFMLGWIARF